MRFGNTLAKYRRGLVIALALGLIVDIVIVFVAPSHEALVANWSVLVLLPAIPLLPFIFISPTLLFSIHIEDGRVRHMFLDRYVLTDLPASDFEDLLLTRSGTYQARRIAERAGFTAADIDSVPGFWAATLYFKHGQKIHFFGAHIRILRSLKDALIAAKQHA